MKKFFSISPPMQVIVSPRPPVFIKPFAQDCVKQKHLARESIVNHNEVLNPLLTTTNLDFVHLPQLHTYVSLFPMKKHESSNLPYGLDRRPIKWEFGGSSVGQMFPRNGRIVTDESKNEEEEIPELASKILNGLSYEEKRRVLRVPAAADHEDLKVFGRYVSRKVCSSS